MVPLDAYPPGGDGASEALALVRPLQHAVAAFRLRRHTAGNGKTECLVSSLQPLLAQLFESSPALVVVKDFEGRYVYANYAFEVFLGRSGVELLGKTDHDVFPKPWADGFQSIEDRVLETGSGTHRTAWIPGAGGFEAFALSTFSILDDRGAPAALCRIASPVSFREYAEHEPPVLDASPLAEDNARLEARVRELEATVEELRAFSYSLSHEIRAPLHGLSGFTAVLKEELGDAPSQRVLSCLGRIQRNTRLMSDLVENLLRLSRLARRPLKPCLVHPAGLVREVIENLAPEFADRRIEVKVDELPPCEADPGALRLVYVNLIGNALKFTRNRPTAHIRIGAREQDGVRHYFVSDDGVGFDMAHADKLFAAFERLHTKREFEGTGVGLALVQRVIQYHGGDVWAEGEVGRGATFFFTLPPVAPADL